MWVPHNIDCVLAVSDSSVSWMESTNLIDVGKIQTSIMLLKFWSIKLKKMPVFSLIV